MPRRVAMPWSRRLCITCFLIDPIPAIARSSSASWNAPNPAQTANPILRYLLIARRSGRRGRDDGTQDRQPLKLLAPDGSLDIGHPVIEAHGEIVLEDHLLRAVSHRIRHAHAVLATTV